MTTDKQIKANKENALKGGVKTDEGKAVSRFNAVKHGLTSVVLSKYDDEVDVEVLEEELRTALQPQNAIENILFERIVENYIRMIRTSKIERNYLNSLLNPPATKKVYKDPQAYEKYKQEVAEYKNTLTELTNDVLCMDGALIQDRSKVPDKPVEPEYEVVVDDGETRHFDTEKLKELVELLNRYYVSGENRLYRAIKEFMEYRK